MKIMVMNKEVIKMDMYQKRKMRQEKKNNDFIINLKIVILRCN